MSRSVIGIIITDSVYDKQTNLMLPSFEGYYIKKGDMRPLSFNMMNTFYLIPICNAATPAVKLK